MQEDKDPTSADMAQYEIKIERAIKERRESDKPLINYWLYLLLVSWVTLGIYVLVVFFQRMVRIDRFSTRKRRYYEGLIIWTSRYAQHLGKEGQVHARLGDMRAEISGAYNGSMRQINAGLSFLFTILTLGIFGFYVLYRVNRYWWDAQVVEQQFDDNLSQVWSKLGLMRYPLDFTLDQRKQRGYVLYLILSFLTLGIWGIVWGYKIHTDPETLYPEFHSNEDAVLQVIRSN